jgi:hypothetical protein
MQKGVSSLTFTIEKMKIWLFGLLLRELTASLSTLITQDKLGWQRNHTKKSHSKTSYLQYAVSSNIYPTKHVSYKVVFSKQD